jgi:hypothetical protein
MIPALNEDWYVNVAHEDTNLGTAQGRELLCDYFRNLLPNTFVLFYSSNIGTKVISS